MWIPVRTRRAPSGGHSSRASPAWISAAAATAALARENARKTPSPAQSTSWPPCSRAAARTSSRRRARTAANRSPSACMSRVDPSMSAKSKVTVPLGSRLRASSRSAMRRVYEPCLCATRLSLHCGDRVRHAFRQAPGVAQRPRPRWPPRRGIRLQGDARGPSRAARGRRQLRGGQGLHGGGQGARARPGRPEEPLAGTAGREDRARGADRADGLRRLEARVRRARRP